jgi:acetyltransferase-like isoleucine patch superfamily enzyme
MTPHQPQRSRLRGLLEQFAFDSSIVLVNTALAAPSHPWRRFALRRLGGAEVGRDVSIARGVRLSVRRGLRIGDRAIVNAGVLLDARGGLEIGADTNISPGVSVFTADHDPRSPGFAGRRHAVAIGRRAWIASQAIVLPGTTIGDGAVVAAGAVVHGDVAPWTIVGGNPAKLIAERPRDAQQRLSPHRRFFG